MHRYKYQVPEILFSNSDNIYHKYSVPQKTQGCDHLPASKGIGHKNRYTRYSLYFHAGLSCTDYHKNYLFLWFHLCCLSCLHYLPSWYLQYMSRICEVSENSFQFPCSYKGSPFHHILSAHYYLKLLQWPDIVWYWSGKEQSEYYFLSV